MRHLAIRTATLVLCAGVVFAQAEKATPAKSTRAPIDGITLEQWARANGRMAYGVPEQRALADLGVSKARWAKINEAWTARLAGDLALGQQYAELFNAAMRTEAAAAGAPGAKDDTAPLPFEKWIEVQAAVSAASDRVYALYGLNDEDRLRVQSFWNLRLRGSPAEAAAHERLLERYQKQFTAAGPAGLKSLVHKVTLAPSGDPIPLERWAEIGAAYDAGLTFTLKRHGLTQAEWLRIITWWGGKLTTGDARMQSEWLRLTDLYTSKYEEEAPW